MATTKDKKRPPTPKQLRAASLVKTVKDLLSVAKDSRIQRRQRLLDIPDDQWDKAVQAEPVEDVT